MVHPVPKRFSCNSCSTIVVHEFSKIGSLPLLRSLWVSLYTCVNVFVCVLACVCMHVCILDCNFTVQVSPLHIKATLKLLLEYPRIDVTLTNEAGHNPLAEAIINSHK